MSSKSQDLKATVDLVLETLPPVWDRIRSNLRASGTGKLGITLEQFHTLRHIRKGYQSVRSLADKRQVSPPAVSQAVEILVKKGLVTRCQEGEDRRRVRLELTSRASEVLDDNYAENRVWMRRKMEGLTASELADLRRAMDILKRAFSSDDGADEGATR